MILDDEEDKVTRREVLAGGGVFAIAALFGASTLDEEEVMQPGGSGPPIDDPAVVGELVVIGGSDSAALDAATDRTVLVISGYGSQYVLREGVFDVAGVRIITDAATLEEAVEQVDTYPTIAITDVGTYTFMEDS